VPAFHLSGAQSRSSAARTCPRRSQLRSRVALPFPRALRFAPALLRLSLLLFAVRSTVIFFEARSHDARHRPGSDHDPAPHKLQGRATRSSGPPTNPYRPTSPTDSPEVERSIPGDCDDDRDIAGFERRFSRRERDIGELVSEMAALRSARAVEKLWAEVRRLHGAVLSVKVKMKMRMKAKVGAMCALSTAPLQNRHNVTDRRFDSGCAPDVFVHRNANSRRSANLTGWS
jgi:hypothetical protein